MRAEDERLGPGWVDGARQYPVGETMSTEPTGGNAFRCTRGGCGAEIGHPVNQDAHNHQVHLGKIKAVAHDLWKSAQIVGSAPQA